MAGEGAYDQLTLPFLFPFFLEDRHINQVVLVSVESDTFPFPSWHIYCQCLWSMDLWWGMASSSFQTSLDLPQPLYLSSSIA